jgi:adenylate cyclase
VVADATVDFVAAPERALPGNLVRLLGFSPFAIAGLLLSFQTTVQRRFQLFAGLFTLIGGSVLLVALSLLEAADWHGLSSWVGLLNFGFIELFIFVIVGLQLRYALFPGVLFLAAYLSLLYAVSGFSPFLLSYYGYHLLTFVLLAMFIAFFRERYIRTDFKKSIQIQDEQRRFEALLYNIIPARIAERLRAGEHPVADAHAEATVLFADLVGSSSLARKLAPHHLIEVLNELYSEFDALAERHGVERIKTMGDSYMAVAGLEPRENTAASDGLAATRVLTLAIEMIRTVRKTSERVGQSLRLRVGIHTGALIAGVLGGRRYQYDVWGDAVNVASRLESTSEPDRVQVSETTYWRTQQHFAFEGPHQIDARGIGKLDAYYLTTERGDVLVTDDT